MKKVAAQANDMLAEDSAESPRKLVWIRDDGTKLEVRPAPIRREWMDATLDRAAYVCPPLAIANAHSWEILNPVSFYVIWNGGTAESDIVIYHDESDGEPVAFSGFGTGILTFRLGGLIRTEPGFDLYVSGPVNRPKTGICPLTGIVETDWATFGLTVSWKITQPNTLIHFAKGEPFCSFFPIPRGVIETFEPRFEKPEEDPEAWESFESFRRDRKRFNEEVQIPDSQARRQRWHRVYLRGPNDIVRPPHRTRVKLKPFK
jgi:hypothetical protein